MYENVIAKRSEKTWGVKVPVTKTFGNKIYSLIGVGYKDYLRTDLDSKRTQVVKVGKDKKGVEIYATYFFGHDF